MFLWRGEPSLARKAAAQIYRKAIKWNGSGKLTGRNGGLIGSHVLLVPAHAVVSSP